MSPKPVLSLAETRADAREGKREYQPVKTAHYRFQNLTGRRFGRTVVVSLLGKHKKATYWTCRCDCGNERVVNTSNLFDGSSLSCGCLQKELITARMTTHGLTETKEYRAWGSLKTRCLNSKDRHWPDYGGRGITVCDRWANNFEAFLEDMGPAPSSQHSIDRKDNDGPYSPGNCRWATPRVQANNRRSSVKVTFQGVQYPTHAALIRSLGLSRDSFDYHFRKKKLPLEEAVAKAATL